MLASHVVAAAGQLLLASDSYRLSDTSLAVGRNVCYVIEEAVITQERPHRQAGHLPHGIGTSGSLSSHCHPGAFPHKCIMTFCALVPNHMQLMPSLFFPPLPLRKPLRKPVEGRYVRNRTSLCGATLNLHLVNTSWLGRVWTCNWLQETYRYTTGQDALNV